VAAQFQARRPLGMDRKLLQEREYYFHSQFTGPDSGIHAITFTENEMLNTSKDQRQ
jgi:hypothetical protein